MWKTSKNQGHSIKKANLGLTVVKFYQKSSNHLRGGPSMQVEPAVQTDCRGTTCSPTHPSLLVLGEAGDWKGGWVSKLGTATPPPPMF